MDDLPAQNPAPPTTRIAKDDIVASPRDDIVASPRDDFGSSPLLPPRPLVLSS